jgi:UDP-N-acetylglucosamine 2-epimerase (non-hydrolysing)
MKLMTVVGTRPELIRLSLLFDQLAERAIDHVLVHTGQNYDVRLSQVFFDELALPAPDLNLGVRAERVGEQIAQIISRGETALLEHRPDALLILGDTDSGLTAIPATRHGIPIFHMEAGNRCFDWRVPEEKNRKLIDHISDWLLPYTPGSRENLLREGIADEKVFVSGNPITDVLEHFRPLWEQSDVLERLGLEPDRYVLVTVHRQETVDVPALLRSVYTGISSVADALELPLVWSLHPRTRERLGRAGIELHPLVAVHEPFSLGEFVALESRARCVLTDSGTVQEECSLLHVPAVTCRDATERPETVECGSNLLCGVESSERMVAAVEVMIARGRQWISPYANDHGVAARVVDFILAHADAG